MKNITKHWVDICKSSLLLFSILLMMNACGLGSSQTGADLNNAEKEDEAANQGTKDDPEKDFGKHQLGVKNFLQIYETMQAVTGLNVADHGNIRNFYNANKTSLPKSNNTESLSASQLLAIVNLAFEFCDAIVDNNTDQAAFFAGTSFTSYQAAAVFYDSPEERLNLVRHFLDKFWGIPLEGSVHREESEQELLALIATLLDGEARNNTTTANTLEGACTAALSSSPVTFF